MRPRLATSERFGIDASGKMASLNPGTRPITEGPRTMPPTTSAMTLGWRSFDRGQ
jgi:hypothetical protein